MLIISVISVVKRLGMINIAKHRSWITVPSLLTLMLCQWANLKQWDASPSMMPQDDYRPFGGNFQAPTINVARPKPGRGHKLNTDHWRMIGDTEKCPNAAIKVQWKPDKCVDRTSMAKCWSISIIATTISFNTKLYLHLQTCCSDTML